MTKLIGYERKNGEYNGKTYDNWVLYLVEERIRVGLAGFEVYTTKFPYDPAREKEFVLNALYEFSWNRFGGLDSFMLSEAQ